MRSGGLINFVFLSSATACLMGVVTRPGSETGSLNYFPSKFILPPDTPVTEEETGPLQFPFKDSEGTTPLLDQKSKLYLEDPENLQTNVEYDPATGNYKIRQKMGDRDYRPETYMTDAEYRDYIFRKQMRDYWRSRVAADDLNNRPRQGMIPKLQVNSELFERIFGGNTVDIKPNGTAELIFGLNRNVNRNPAIPQRQQKITNFDFNMRIQLNLIGKIGDKLKVTTNYNTEASFDWENQVKIDYTGYEDDIIKKIEGGNVTLPLNSSLISGSQTLFGFKTELQFGKLRATTVFSQQKGKKTEITVQGGAQMQTFTRNADEYEHNKHYFLGHYFREHYDAWMRTLPVITTPVVITKVEVYLLGINGSAEQTRNVVAFEDLGEDISDVYTGLTSPTEVSPGFEIRDSLDIIPSNGANSLYKLMMDRNSGVLKERNINEVSQKLSSINTATNLNNSGNIYMDGSRDYNIIRNARRLNPTDYYLNTRTGFISLNQQLSNEQSLAVSYQYTYLGKTYQVGEFSENVPENDRFIVCKLLKSAVVNVHHPTWKLMMKNVYALGAYNLNPQDFKLDVFYNNIETGVDIPYLPVGSRINGIQLIRVLGADRISVNGDKRPDGFYDFLPGFTISQNNGRAYFPTVEPFGRSLEAEFAATDEVAAGDKYIFKELYDSTKTAASFIQNKNRYKIKGSYRSSSGSEIQLNAMQIPQGAVIVTANGVALTENVDYQVDYGLGRVKIINEGILNSGATVKVSLESNSLFSVQQKSLLGTRLDYKAGRNLTLGGTFLRFNERPMVQKVSFGEEPVKNIVAGFDFNHKTDAPILTRLLDKLPFYSTKEMSSITTRGEIAKLFPGNAAAIKVNGGNSYIDDFEGSIALIDIKGANSWFLSSIPQGQPKIFPEASLSDTIATGLNRARLIWYNVDPMFTREQFGTTPSHYSSQKLFSNNMWRQVFEKELFPGKIPPNGQQVVLPLLDLGFFPSDRGQYNYDVKGQPGISSGINRDGTLKDPRTRWGGIMRRLETNDFQLANIEYIQFWLMDPFNEDYNVETDSLFDKNNLPRGELFFNIGNISEDIIKDGRMVYENGLPGRSSFSQNLSVDTNNVAKIPEQAPIINAFSQDNDDRPYQDVGYDGFSDEEERAKFKQPLQDIEASTFDQNAPAIRRFKDDPSSDRYHFFRGDDYDNISANTVRRYSRYNNPEGNSPTEAQYSNANPNGGNYPTGATNTPNIEDINRDNTLSEAENYYQYRVRVSPESINENVVGSNFIVDAFEGVEEFSGVTKKVKWYQFKIPINQFEQNVGNIEGFNSIRFMRVFLRGFDRPVLLRLARLELVRSDWRRYQFDLKQPGEYIVQDVNSTSFDVSAVSLQENATKTPVNYVMPPQIDQTQNVQTTNLVLQNEQALQMRVCDLRDGDSRAIFKNVEFDTRMFNNIKMNVHANKLNDMPLKDGDLHLFFRVGTDYNNNFYEYEVPLKITPEGKYDPNSDNARKEVWPPESEVNFRFADINMVKEQRNKNIGGDFTNLNEVSTPYSMDMGGYTVTIVGNPNLATVRSVMVGVRNPKSPDNFAHCVEVWVNELRLTDFNNQGGWATTGQMQAKLADLGMLSLAGTYKSPFWGSVESKINDRTRETNTTWDVSTSVNAGKFFPANWKITLPVFYNYGQTKIKPLFNPLDPDVKFSDLDRLPDDDLKRNIEQQVIDYTERKGFNVSNVRIDGFKRPNARPYPWDLGNFSFTYAYSEIFRRSVNVEYNYNRLYRGNIQYAYSIRNPLTFRPFTKVKFFDKKAFALIKDFHLQLTPNNFGFSTDVNRTYTAIRNRDITSFYAGSVQFVNPTLVNKNFLMNRTYNFRWDLNKSLKFDYSASNEGRILEPYGETWSDDKVFRDSVISTFLNGIDRNGNLQGKYGENTVYRQQMNLNADLPLNKIPILDFTKVNYRFSGSYTWNRRPFAASDSIGNTIQNTNVHNVTGNFNLVQLYNKVPYLKKLNTPQPKRNPAPNKPPTGARGQTKDDSLKKKESKFKEIAELLARTLMMVKNISLTFQEDGGQALPNFRPSSQYGGMDFRENQAPGFRFTTGLHDEQIRQRSATNNWLVQYGSQTTPYIETFRRNYSYRTNIEPHGSLKIELNGSYTKSSNLTEYIYYDPTDPRNENGYLFHESPFLSGSFNISTFSLHRTFKDGSDPVESKLFDEFMADRQNVARDLSAKNEESFLISGGPGVRPYYKGYSENQQDVLLGAFYRTYTGKDIKDYSTKNIFPSVPLPNWTVTWDGLGKIPALKKTFRGITVRHKYSSMYNINGFSNNILFNPDGITQDQPMPVSSGTNEPNFVPFYNITTVTLRESFEPLIKFDLQFQKTGWSANVETRRDKTTNLNLTGFQIIETKGQEYTIGLGYRHDRLKFKRIMIQGKPLESPLIVKLDMSFRKNISVIRQISEGGVSVPTGGTNIVTLRSSADYQLTPNITLRIFYDWVKTIPQTSASFPTANANGGFSLRINFQ